MKLHCETRSNPGKPELVMLHGWGMSSQVWGEFADQLAEHFSLTLIDLPGLGQSQDYPEPYTTAAVVEALLAYTPERAYWLGWSMGGQIAIALAAMYPERVETLITLASNPCFVAREDWSCGMPEDTHAAFEESTRQQRDKTLLRFIMLQTQGAEAGKETLHHLKQVLQHTTPAAAYESLAPLREDMRTELQSLTQPVLQLFGEKDLLVPVAAADACQALTGKAIKVYAGAGHLPFYSHCSDVVRDVVAFSQGQAV